MGQLHLLLYLSEDLKQPGEVGQAVELPVQGTSPFTLHNVI
jgi:hypothetical protein